MQLRALERPREWEQDWVKRIHLDGEVTGVFADYHYVGTGDIGGAARESTVTVSYTHLGFLVDDTFLVGYGLGAVEQTNRNIPYLAAIPVPQMT